MSKPVKHPRLMLALLVLVVLVGAANVALYVLVREPMQLVMGLVLIAAGLVNLARMRRETAAR